MADDNIHDARRQAAAIAAEVLAGRMSAVLGAIELDRLRSLLDVSDDDPDFEKFMLINSECLALPIGAVRQHWSAAALALRESEIAHAESWAMEVGRQALTNIVTRFAEGLQ